VDEALAVAEEHAFFLEVEGLVQQGEAAEGEHLGLRDAEGEGHAALLEELDDLDEVLAGVCEGDDRGGGLVAEGGADGWTVEQAPDVIVSKRLLGLAWILISGWRTYQQR